MRFWIIGLFVIGVSICGKKMLISFSFTAELYFRDNDDDDNFKKSYRSILTTMFSTDLS